MHKSNSRTKISKLFNQTHKPKQSNGQKASPDNHAIHMKSNLKQLISKNAGSKTKNVDYVPDIIKNIEKHCK